MKETVYLKIKVFVIALVALTQPINSLMLTAFLFIIADTFFGIYTAFVQKKKTKVIAGGFLKNLFKGNVYESHRGRDFFRKICIYFGAIILTYVAEKSFLDDIIHLIIDFDTPYLPAKIVALIVCVNELVSINESVKLNTGEGVISKIKRIVKLGKANVIEIKTDIKEAVES